VHAASAMHGFSSCGGGGVLASFIKKGGGGGEEADIEVVWY
jgi:hypothetical protein